MEKTVRETENVRLDAWIAKENTDLSRTMIQKLIEEGQIKVNGQTKKMSYKVQLGDVITIHLPPVKDLDLKPQNIPVEVVYEDEDIIVVNKPKGMVVHPANRKSGWYFSQCYNGNVQG